MKKILKNLILLTILIINNFFLYINILTYKNQKKSSSNCLCNNKFKSYARRSSYRNYHFRSQGSNTARELVGWQWEINKPYMDETYGSLYLAYEYQHSFKSRELARTILGDSILYFEGSQIIKRDKNALVADYFGLPSNFKGRIKFKPTIENQIVDFGFYLGLDSFIQGGYFRVHAPFAYTKWNLNPCREIIDNIHSLETNFIKCYMGPTNNIDNNKTTISILEALSGNFLFADMQTKWCANKFIRQKSEKGLADIDLILGYNFLNDDCYHLGLYIQGVMPTGNKKDNKYILQPVVGNGKHFELGGGISAHLVLFSTEFSNLAFFLEGNITHMFKNHQYRLFDFIQNGKDSKYLLLKEFQTNGSSLYYSGNLISATCFNNRRAEVSIAIRGDASIKLAYRYFGWGVDLGYNIYGHTKENVKILSNVDCNTKNRKFGIKGLTGVCAYQYPIVINNITKQLEIVPNNTSSNNYTNLNNCNKLSDIIDYTTIPDNRTQSNATIYSIKEPKAGNISINSCYANLAYNSPSIEEPILVEELNKNNSKYEIINNEVYPNILSIKDLDPHSGAAPASLTNKIFLYIDYTWADDNGWDPYVGFGSSIEFSNYYKGVLNQWGILFKGGFAF